MAATAVFALADTPYIAVSIFSYLCCIAMIVGTGRYLKSSFAARITAVPSELPDVSGNASFGGQLPTCPPGLVEFTRGKKHWVDDIQFFDDAPSSGQRSRPKADEIVGFCRRNYHLFAEFDENAPFFIFFEFGICILLGLFHGARFAVGGTNCARGIAVAMGIVLMIELAVIIAKRPYRTQANMLTTTLISSLLLVSLFTYVGEHDDVSTILALCALVLLFLRLIFINVVPNARDLLRYFRQKEENIVKGTDWMRDSGFHKLKSGGMAKKKGGNGDVLGSLEQDVSGTTPDVELTEPLLRLSETPPRSPGTQQPPHQDLDEPDFFSESRQPVLRPMSASPAPHPPPATVDQNEIDLL